MGLSFRRWQSEAVMDGVGIIYRRAISWTV
jgi:hypothetical protein